MKKIINKILIGTLVLFSILLIKLPTYKATSCQIKVSAPKSVVVGQTFNVSVNISSSGQLGTFAYNFGYDTTLAKLNSGTVHVVDYTHVGNKTASYSYSFTALKSGNLTLKPSNVEIVDYDGNDCSTSVGSATIGIKTQAQIEASYSKNNNLASLSVEGTSLSPVFNANIIEYQATLPVDTTKAIINASLADKTATVTGTGEINVVDGLNKVEVVVTAQNGSKKTYVINLTVEELEPIEVKIDGKTYQLVRKTGQVENIPVGFSETKISIENQDVVAYKSDIAKITLVALKDSDGNVELFIYNASKKSYSIFSEVKGSSVNLLILEYDGKDIPDGFIKTSFEYNNKTINGYKLKNDDNKNYYLVYAKNLETGSEDFYLLDKKDNTFQRYFSGILKQKEDKIKLMEYIIIGLFSALVLIILILIIVLFKNIFTSKDKKVNKYKLKIKKLSNNKNEDYFSEISKEEGKPSIKKVEEDEFVVPKKSKKQRKMELIEAKKKLEETKPSFRRVSLEDDED